jgi:uncharacterized delta-60 repeat protein
MFYKKFSTIKNLIIFSVSVIILSLLNVAQASAQDFKSVFNSNFTASVTGRKSSAVLPSAFVRDGALDSTFSALPAETGGFVQAILRLPDGKTLIGGNVPSIAGFATKDVARINPDGTPDLSFNTGAGSNGLVYRLHLQPDGKILVSGRFSTFNNFQRSAIVRLNQDGSVDPTFNVTVDTFSGIYALVCGVEPDGKIVICGNFTSVNGVARRQIARLNPSGSLDTSFDYGTTPPTNYVHAVRYLPGGKMLVGGLNNNGNGILRLNSNGSVDTTFSLGYPIGGVFDIVLLPDGKFIGVNDYRVVRYNADGSLDSTYTHTDVTFQSLIRSAIVQPDGKIILFGDFSLVVIGNETRGCPGMARLNNDGSFDDTFVTPMTGNGHEVYAASLEPDGRILIGGSFDRVQQARIKALARINPDGSFDGTFLGLTLQRSIVFSQYLLPDGKIFVGGGFSLLNVSPRQFFGRLNSNGEVDNSFVPTSLLEGVVTVIVKQPDGKFLVGGSTSDFGNKALWRLNSDGSIDSSFNVAFNSGTYVSAAAVAADGKILITGGFQYINGSEQHWFARLNSDGSVDTSFNVTFSQGTGVKSMLVQPDGKIIIGGEFSSVNGTPLSGKLARLNPDGSLDSSFTPFTGGTFSQINGIFLLNGRLFVASLFSGSNNQSRFPLVKLNDNGTVDWSFNAGNLVGNIYSASAAPDGKIIVGGEFNTYAESGNRKQIVRLMENGSLDYTFDAGTLSNPQTIPSGPSPPVFQVAVTNDNKVLMSGDFDNIAGQTRWSIARLKTNSCVTRSTSDFDGDGKTDVSIFRPSNGVWYLQNSYFANTVRGLQFGIASDKLVPADYDGDGRSDTAVYRPSNGTWYIINSGNLSYHFEQFGTSEDVPYPADFDGDGRADIAVFRPSSGVWYLLRSSQGFTAVQFGQQNDVPVARDYDGDCKADIAVFRPSVSEWWFLHSSNGQAGALQFGNSTDKPVPGDYTGDGKTDVAFFRPSTSEWFVLRSEDLSYYSFPFGLSDDTPTPGDYDADGRADAAVFRASDKNWYLQKSTDGFTAVQFGLSTDKPVPASYIP